MDDMLPNLVIIGAMKCGTTSLYYYLRDHPQIFMSCIKELNFFSDQHNWSKGFSWYESHFHSNADVRGECSHLYTNFPCILHVPQRIFHAIPDVKLIYIVGDPIKRIISQYVHYYSKRLEDRPIDEVLKNPVNGDYVNRSRYFMQLQQYFEYFPRQQILIVNQDDLYLKRRDTLKGIFQFLNVDENFWSRKYQIIRNPSKQKRRKTGLGNFLAGKFGDKIQGQFSPEWGYKFERIFYFPFSHKVHKPVLSENLQNSLIGYLREDINCLRKYTGCKFAQWSV